LDILSELIMIISIRHHSASIEDGFKPNNQIEVSKYIMAMGIIFKEDKRKNPYHYFLGFSVTVLQEKTFKQPKTSFYYV
jgi:hypothetical protein